MLTNVSFFIMLNVCGLYSYSMMDISNFSNCSICSSDHIKLASEKCCFKVFLNDEQMLGELFGRKFAALVELDSMNFPPGIFRKYLVNELTTCQDKSLEKFPLINRNELWTMGTAYINDARKLYLPSQLIPGGHREEFQKNRDRVKFNEIKAWSELVIFDFLIGNIDRVLSLYINHQWNSHIFNYHVPNLGLSNGSMLLYFDNDAAFFQGYRILEKYDKLHHQLLKQVPHCPRILMDRLEDFNNLNSVQFQKLFLISRPLQIWNDLSDINQNLSLDQISILLSRIRSVLEHCEKLDSS